MTNTWTVAAAAAASIATAITSANQHVSATLLRWIQFGLDDYGGAWDWNLRHVAVVTALLLGCIRFMFGKKGGIDWYALLHAVITGVGSLVCVYLTIMTTTTTTTTTTTSDVVSSLSSSSSSSSVALRALACQEPLTSLHRILPAITMGYSIFDLIDGFFIGYDFMFHGAATLALMAFFCELGQPQLVTPMLLMEVSTCFLTVVRADFVSPTISMLIQAGFVLCFFLFRICIVPILWWDIAYTLLQQHYRLEHEPKSSSSSSTSSTAAASAAAADCHFPMSYILPAVWAFGIFFHTLNAYWFYKIIRKIQRKMAGIEKIQENNDLGEPDTNKKLSIIIVEGTTTTTTTTATTLSSSSNNNNNNNKNHHGNGKNSYTNGTTTATTTTNNYNYNNNKKKNGKQNGTTTTTTTKQKQQPNKND